MRIHMPSALIHGLWGPILGKELRVSSRRRRNYVVRTAYLVLLTLFVTWAWVEVAQGWSQGPALQVWMARVGRSITVLIVWFQFVTCQVVAAVSLSAAISDEVHHRTLGVLMTTPINGLQIVLGKLLSRLFQTLILIALSLPLLAVVRVFGGIPWDFLVGGLALTVAAMLFAGSVSLFLSISCRRAYVVTLCTTVGLVVLWGLIPWIAFLAADAWDLATGRRCYELFATVHPYFGLAELTGRFTAPGTSSTGMAWLWIRPSVTLLICSAILLTVSAVRVRTVALRQIAGGVQACGGPLRARGEGGKTVARLTPIRGCPVLWRETRVPLLGRRRGLTILGLVLACGALVPVYWAAYDGHDLDDSGFHSVMVFLYMLLGGLFAAVLPAPAITMEKETRSWPILLGTALGDLRIVLAKGAGAIRRGLPAWAFLAVHVAVFTAFRTIHPLGVVQLALVVLGLTAFLTGSGLYFSARLRHTTGAVIANIALPCVLWVVVPIVMTTLRAPGLARNHVVEGLMASCPFVQGPAIMEAFAQGPGARPHMWPVLYLDEVRSTAFVVATTAMYVGAACLLAWRAKCDLRRRIF